MVRTRSERLVCHRPSDVRPLAYGSGRCSVFCHRHAQPQVGSVWRAKRGRNCTEEILGKKEGRRFLPVLATMFFLIFAMNLPSVIPGLNISPNARVGMPLVLAIVGYFVFIYAGAKRYGFFKYVKSSIVIPNLPPALHILVVPLEFLSTFILRPATLTLRLMANMLAGHIILVLMFSATNFFFFQMNGWTTVSFGTIIAAIAFTLFELLVIFLQAYIFSLLSAVYIELALHADEH